MKCTAKWSYRPYLPYDRYAEAGKPSICRLAPSEDGCEVEWIGRGEAFRLSYAPEGIDRYETVRRRSSKG